MSTALTEWEMREAHCRISIKSSSFIYCFLTILSCAVIFNLSINIIFSVVNDYFQIQKLLDLIGLDWRKWILLMIASQDIFDSWDLVLRVMLCVSGAELVLASHVMTCSGPDHVRWRQQPLAPLPPDTRHSRPQGLHLPMLLTYYQVQCACQEQVSGTVQQSRADTHWPPQLRDYLLWSVNTTAQLSSNHLTFLSKTHTQTDTQSDEGFQSETSHRNAKHK